MKVKKDKNTIRQLNIAFASFIIIFTGIVFFADLGEYRAFKQWLLFVSGASLFLGFILFKIMYYKCRICGSKIAHTKEWKNGFLFFKCNKCDVLWNTTITPSSSSDYSGGDF